MRKELVYLATRFIPAVVLLCAVVTQAAQAQNTIHVPADQPTIQQAIQVASDGDTILVSPGTYFERLFFTGRAITVSSTDGPAVTTIDGLGSTVVTFQNGEGNYTVLRGFTITDGFGFNGGAIFANSSSPTIDGNVITANQGCVGAGIMLQSSNAIVRHNTISNNNTQGCGGSGAAGIEIDGQGSPQILNNIITGNHAFLGGGIQLNTFAGTPVISANIIQNNISDADGGGILSNSANVMITDNLVSGNQANGNGGGVNIVPGTFAVLVNNTVAANSATLGAQLYIDGSTGVQLSNNILYDLTGTGAVYCSFSGGTVFPNFDSNDAVSLPANAPGTFSPPYSGSCEDITGFNGNIQKDPLFVNAAENDYHLSPTSPAVDAGNNAALNLPVLDLDGNPRVGAGDPSCRGIVDMGAYELVFATDGSAVLSSNNLPFPLTSIGVPSAPQSLVLTGTQGCTQIASITTTGDYTQTSDCSALQPGNSCTIQVTFAPKAPGIREGSLAVNLRSTLQTAPLIATLNGQAQNSGSVFPTSIDFGNQLVQTSSQAQFVGVSQAFIGPLVVNSVVITGDFSQNNFCTGLFAFGGNCSINVTFTPTRPGLRTGTLTVNTNQGIYTVPLLGNGAAPQPDFSPTSLAFPTQTVGTISAEQTATLTNDGSADLQIAGLVVNGDFAVTGNNCPAILAASASCTFRITFNPTATGPETGTLTVNANSGSATLLLSGTGTTPIATFAPQTLTFVLPPLNTTSDPQTLVMTNISGAPLQLNSIGAPDDFLAVSSCPQVLDVNSSCPISVTLTPLAPGTQGGFLSVATSLGTVTATLAITDGHRTIHVPADSPTIASAVSIAQDGDIILVAPGTYFEQVSFQGKAITIASASGPATTIIDGSFSGPPVFITQMEGPKSVLRGFTVTHGEVGGIFINSASPTIENNIITNNSGCGGVGITASFSGAVIQSNLISNNSNVCGSDGGGVVIKGSFNNNNVQLLRNTITGNQTRGNGGGVLVQGPATITSNIVQNNSAGLNGGGILAQGTTVTLTNNLVTGNIAGQSGGGIYISGSVSPLSLFNNTIADNISLTAGGAVYVDGSAQIANNIIVDSSGLGAIACGQFTGLLPDIEFNDVIGAPGQPNSVYTIACSDMTGINGNIQQDPQFVNESSGDYHPQSSSPAIDAGVEFVGSLPDTDLDGKPRVGPGPFSNCTSRVDLGAYEFALTSGGGVFGLPASMDFGSATIGSTVTQPLSVNVTGCVPLASVKVTGDFQQTNPCNGAIGGTFGSCQIQVSFVPTALGTRTGTLTLDFGAVAPPQTITLTGQALGITPAAFPTSVNFGAVVVQSSSTQTVNIEGQIFSLPFSVNGIWITGDFAQANNCTGTGLQTGPGFCSIAITFTPATSGPRTGLLTVSTNQGIVTVPLSGSGLGAAAATLAPTSLTFGSQPVGTVSAAQLATLTNTGSLSFIPGAVTISTGFTVNASQCQVTLNPGQSCNYAISFAPVAAGPASGIFTVQTDAGSFSVSLSGNGATPFASVSPQSLTFAAQALQTTSSAQAVTVSNTGTAPLSVSGVTITGDFAQTNSCSVAVPPGGSCTIQVTFTPTITGSRSGILSIVSNGGSAAVSLSGTGANQLAALSATSTSFGSELLNATTRAVTVVLSAGVNPLQISSINVSGDFAETNTCGASLAPATSCSMNLTFTPLTAGAESGTLTVTTNEGQLSAALSGTGLTRAANTIYVPVDQPSIQAAITAAQAGQTVMVLRGVYLENPDFQGKAISVTSSDGPAFTIVDGNAAGPVVIFQTNEGANSVLNGFTLRNGVPSQAFGGFGTSGGGVLIVNASPTITGNVITGNHAICGIGMEIRGGSAVIRGNTITGNTQAFGDGGCGGGGIEVTGDSSHPAATPLITGNTITNNSLNGGGNGGGIAANFFASPTIQNNYIAGNAVFNSGGGIFAQTQTPVVVAQNIIVNNSAGGGGSGGGIYAGSIEVVINNTIVGNTAFDGSSGIFADSISPITISNNIVVAVPGQTGVVCSPFSSTFPTFSHNDVTSPIGGEAFSSNCAIAAQGNGNISLDPQFVNATNNDFHLQPGSPAIDAGDNAAPNPPQEDYDGNPRIAFGSAVTCTNTVDMGVYELVLSASPSATLSPATLDFGGVPVGTSSTAQTFTLAATQGCVAKPAITVTGDFSETDNCGSVLGTGASCSIQMTFTPSAAGTRTGSLAVSSGTISLSSSLTGVGTVPNPVFSTGAVSFGNVRVGTNATQTITMTNSGTATFLNNGLVISGAVEFTQTSNCPATLAPGASCTINITFSPVARGARSATLSVTTSQAVSTPTVSLSGNGVAPVAVLTQSLTFAAQPVGTTSSQTATLSNAGDATLDMSAIATTGDFAQSNACGANLAPGVSCNITVSFTPAAAGTRTGTLTVSDDDLTAPQQSTSLSGTGLDYALSASPSSISVRMGHQVQTSITVSAVGGSFANAVALSCANLPTGASCSFSPASVVPGATSASSTLTVNTQASGGVKTARGTYTITVNGNSSGLVRSTAITLTVQ